MAATIKTASQAFTEFARRNALTSTQRAKLRTRRDRVARYLRDDGWVVAAAKFGGSHARRTKARLPMDARSDVDVYVVLDRRHKAEYGSGWGQRPPKQLLTDIKASLDKKLDTPAVRADSPSVRITYADMLVDVVPAFSRLFGGSYDIPYYDRWMTATPDAQRSAFTRLNSTCGGLAIDLVRMLKHWKAQHPSFGLRSYHLEVLAYDALNQSDRQIFELGWPRSSAVAPGGPTTAGTIPAEVGPV